MDYPVKGNSFWRGNQEKDTECLCPRWLRLSPERWRRITPSLCSRTNEDWFLEAAAQFPSSIPTPPSSPAVTSAPLHVLSCLCRKAQAHPVPLEPEVCSGPAGCCWHPWQARSQQPQLCTGRGHLTDLERFLTFPPSYQIWVEVINKLGVLLLKERKGSEMACGYLLFIKIKRSRGRNWHTMHKLNKMPGFWKPEVRCLSVQHFWAEVQKHQPASAAALFSTFFSLCNSHFE